MDFLECTICGGDIEHHKTPEGKVFWTEGHNAHPITDGRCCDTCNNKSVIPARLLLNAARALISQLKGTSRDYAVKYLGVDDE